MTEAKKSPKAPPVDPTETIEAVAEPVTAAKAKKEKAPTPEDKLFADFVQQDLIPAIQTSLTAQGWTDLNLQFAQSPVSISGVSGIPDCWQVIGRGQQGKRQFNIYFFEENIQGQRGFSCSSNQGRMSSIESFLIDERKMTLDLLMFGLMKRLKAQQWLSSSELTAVS